MADLIEILTSDVLRLMARLMARSTPYTTPLLVKNGLRWRKNPVSRKSQDLTTGDRIQ